MRLYHFAMPGSALLLGLGRPLKPGFSKDGNQWQTMGVPVVWLTKEESNLATADDMKLAAAFDPPIELELGEPRYGGPVRCIVEIERSKHIMRYAEFLRTTTIVAVTAEGEEQTGRQLLQRMEPISNPGVFTSWWICKREIPASRIWVPMTRAQAIEGCDWHAKHSAPEGREQWTKQRHEFAAQSDDSLFMIHNGTCGTFNVKDEAA